MAGLSVYFEARRVGVIEVGDAGPTFTYDDAWLDLRGAFPISVTMPLRVEAFGADVILPWASNLLPESQSLQTLGHLMGKSTADVIGILSEVGRDTAGALSIGRPGRSRVADYWRPIESDNDLERIINELPNKPFLIGDDGVSMSLAGVQTKLAVARDGDRLCIPIDGAPSTHILKPDSDRLFGGVQNEAFCLVLGRKIGLTVPDVTTGKAGSRSYLLVERYDRRLLNGRWRRLHQEDFCQALGKPPGAKYQTNHLGIPGPTLKDMFGVSRKHMRPAEILKLLDIVIFNVLCVNTDAHAKNYALLLSAGGASMAPVYDVMCADVFDGVTKNMAQKIAGKSRGDHLCGRHWQRMAVECGLNPSRTLQRVERLASSVLMQAEAALKAVEAMPAGGHAMLKNVHDAVIRRAQHIKTQIAEVEPDHAP